MVKICVSLFLIYLILMITLNSSIVIARNNPSRSRTILNECSVDAVENVFYNNAKLVFGV